MRPRLADAVAFALLGFGASWTLSDVIYTNLPTFIRCLPGGLFLPDELGLAARPFFTPGPCPGLFA